MLLTSEQIDILPSGELRPLLKELMAKFELLSQRVASLETENERLKRQLTGLTNSRNSSQPPSRDQKTNQPEKKTRKHGAAFGHKKFARPLVDNPDQVIQVPVTECKYCFADLTGVEPDDFEQRQITELRIRFITSDVAVADVNAEILGQARAAGGRHTLSGKFRTTHVFKKKKGSWRVVVFRSADLRDRSFR